MGRTTVRTEPAGGGSRGCRGGRRGHPQLAELGKGTPAQNWETDSCLDFTTNEAALKSDAWFLEPNGEKSRLLPTTVAAYHLPGRWVSGRGGGHHVRSRSADLCVSPGPAWLPGPASVHPRADTQSPRPHKTGTACCLLLPRRRSSQGPQHRKQETAAFLSSDEEHCHMATPPPPASPQGARPLIPQSLGRVHMVGWGCFQFPFPGGWKIPAVWAQIEEWQAFPTKAGCSQPTSQPASFCLPLPLLPLVLPLHPTLTQGWQFAVKP